LPATSSALYQQPNEVPMARANYSFEKRQREMAKKKKKEEKRRRKLENKAASSPDDASGDQDQPESKEEPEGVSTL